MFSVMLFYLNMNLIIIVIFIFCAALAAGGILLVSRLMNEYQYPFIKSLFYHIIFIFAFGFYGVWGQFIIAAVSVDKLTPELISSVSVISLLLGLPFLVFGWLMLLRFAVEVAGGAFKGIITAVFLALNFGVIILMGVTAGDNAFIETLPMIKYYYSAAAMLFSVAAAIILTRGRGCTLVTKDRVILAAIITTGAVSQAAVLLLFPHTVWMALIFIFLLFSTTTLLPLFLTYNADIKSVRVYDTLLLPSGIEDFFRKNEISPREADIIREICNGLSNQEIADKLFISLQTVKDHTSRIYSKTNVRNRMQLMTLVQGLQV